MCILLQQTDKVSNTNTAGQVMTGAQEKNKAGDGDRAERRLEEGEGGSC